MKITNRRLFESVIKDSEKKICEEVCGEEAWFWLCFSIWESFINLKKINKGIFKYIYYNDINENS